MNTNTETVRGLAVRIFLGAAGELVREGFVLVDYGDTLLVEYPTARTEKRVFYATKKVSRDRVEVLA